MMTYGEKIAKLRKSKGMTQEDLGKVLNVTYQAVSKWERGESLPDFETMSQIAKYFQVPLSYFEEGNESAEPLAPVRDETAAGRAGVADGQIVGMCTECGRALKENEVSVYSPKLVCKPCAERKRQAAAEAQRQYEETRRAETERSVQADLGGKLDVKLIISLVLAFACYILFTVLLVIPHSADDNFMYGFLLFFLPVAVFACTHSFIGFISDLREKDEFEGYTRNLSLITAAGFSVVNALVFLIVYLTTKNDKLFFLIMLFAGMVLSFTFISQFMWGGVVGEIFTGGGITFKMPGFIFSLTLDSILWMIVTKILLGILSVLIFVVTTIVFALVAVLGSVFIFIPSLLSKTFKDRKAKARLKDI